MPLPLPSASVLRLGCAATALLPLLAVPSAKAITPMPGQQYEGYAYARDNGVLLYRESHWQYQQDGIRRRLVLYRCPDGKAFARKQVIDGPNALAPDFELDDARSGYREGVRSQGGQRTVFWQARGQAERSGALAAANGLVVDAGFDAFVRQRWDGLAKGEVQKVAFLVPSRLAPLDLRLQPAAAADGTHSYRLSLDAWYSAAAPSLDVTYTDDGRVLRRFEGIGNIRTANGKYPAVRIEFPPAERRSTTPAAVAIAARQPLVSQCTG